jgi:dihydrofolate synthase/folylpolyglutamate synthase
MTLKSSDKILKRMMDLHPKVIDLTLDRVLNLLDALKNPHKKLPPVIHIAGTNGKGSTLSMIRSGLESSGKSVHTYTSPHLIRFNERIRLAGKLITEDELSAILDECYEANTGEEITYFEITTCAAILAMSRQEADYTLLEVGLGGRLDATNVVERPELAVITPISLDHEQFLGNSIEKISLEKAGIIKKNTPVIVSSQNEKASEVIEKKALALNAPIYSYGHQWLAWEERGRLVYQDERGLLDVPFPSLKGDHQIINAGCALQALRLLENGQLTNFEEVTAKAHWPARMQKLKNGVLNKYLPSAEIWLDGGHNPAAGKVIAAHLSKLTPRPTYAICGMLNTKDVKGFLKPLKAQIDKLFGISIPEETNTLSGKETSEEAKGLGIESYVSISVEAALEIIKNNDENPRIIICGSLYLAGHVLKLQEYEIK